MTKIKEIFHKYKEIVLYLFFGGCTTLVNILVYFFCRRLGLGVAEGTITAWILSVLFAYITNRKFVFQTKKEGTAGIIKEFVSFFLCRLATGVIDLLIMLVFVDILHFNDVLLKILSNIIVIILNYVASKIFIFKKSKYHSKISFRVRICTILQNVGYYCCFLFGVYIFLSLLLNIFIDNSVSDNYIPNKIGISNVVFIPISILLFILSVTIVWKLKNQINECPKNMTDKRFYLILALCYLCVFLLQLFISSNIYFKSGWDAFQVRSAAENIVYNGAIGLDNVYFDRYPNNIMLVYTLVLFYKIGNVLYSSNPYMVVVVIVNFIVCLSVFLSTLCIYRITKNRSVTIIGMIIGIVLTALSPWIIVPYSDAIGMIFPVSAIFGYVFIKNKYWKYATTTFFSLLGYFYKPTSSIIFIALILLSTASLINLLIKKTLSVKHSILCIMAVLIAATGVFVAQKAVTDLNKTEIAEQDRVTMTHYLMMGLNAEYEGVYSYDDVLYSWSFPDVSSRQAANIEVAKDRIREMGPSGLIKLLVKKNLNNYNDGSFAWSREGSFYYEVPESKGKTADLLRSIYYAEGENHTIFLFIEQVIWLMILISISFCVFIKRKNNDVVNLIALSLLGLSIFLLIFECRSRYLFVYSPLFVVLASVGIFEASNIMDNYLSKKSSKQLTHQNSVTS